MARRARRRARPSAPAPWSPIRCWRVLTTACRGEQRSPTPVGREPAAPGGRGGRGPGGHRVRHHALAFTYRDENNNVTASPDLIRSVEISVTVQTATRGAFVTMVDRVRLRNR
jgi:hypothetical protein